MHFVGKLNKEIFRCISEEIQINHIKERYPAVYEKFSIYFDEMVRKPNYIIEASKPNTALILKQITLEGEMFKLVLRLATSRDNPEYKNSIITFMKIDDKEWNRLLRNKKYFTKKNRYDKLVIK